MSSDSNPANEHPNNERLETLIDLLLDDALDPSQRRELDAILSNDDRAAAKLVEAMDLHAMLQWEHGQIEHESEEDANQRAMLNDIFDQALEQRRLHEVESQAQSQLLADLKAQKKEADFERRRAAIQQKIDDRPTTAYMTPRALPWLALAGAIGLVVWLGVISSSPSSVPSDSSDSQQAQSTPAQPTTPAFSAILREDVVARWASPETQPVVGESMDDRTYHLVSGLARFEMGLGASVVIEGPAQLRMTGPNRMVLESGRLTAVVPEQAHGFTVVTPNAKIVDLGTSFGVDVLPNAGTFAQVFTGEITLATISATQETAMGGGAVILRENQAVQIDAAGTLAQVQAIEPDRFVQREVFDALAGHAGESSQAQAILAMWERNPSLIAAESFGVEGQSFSYGWASAMRTTKGRLDIDSESLFSGSGLATQGGRLLLDASEPTTVFLDLDLSPGSPADLAGLVVPGTRELGRDGTRVCIAWTTQLDEGRPTDDGWFGLSLFLGSDDRDMGEMAFFGQIFGQSNWAGNFYRASPHALRLPEIDNTFTLGDGESSEIEIGRAYRWLVVIDFRLGNERVSIYLDPDPDHLGSPDQVMTGLYLRFDRLHIATDSNNCRWSVDELRLGTDIQSVLTD